MTVFISNLSDEPVSTVGCRAGELQEWLGLHRWRVVPVWRSICTLGGGVAAGPGENSRTFGLPPSEVPPGTYRARVLLQQSGRLMHVTSHPFEVR